LEAPSTADELCGRKGLKNSAVFPCAAPYDCPKGKKGVSSQFPCRLFGLKGGRTKRNEGVSARGGEAPLHHRPLAARKGEKKEKRKDFQLVQATFIPAKTSPATRRREKKMVPPGSQVKRSMTWGSCVADLSSRGEDIEEEEREKQPTGRLQSLSTSAIIERGRKGQGTPIGIWGFQLPA